MTVANIDTFVVLTIAARIMFLLSSIFRKNDPKAGGGVAMLAKLFEEVVE